MTTHLIPPPSTGQVVITLCCDKTPEQLPYDDRLSWTGVMVNCPSMTVPDAIPSMRPAAPLGRDTLAAPRGSERADRFAAIRRLDDGTVGARLALQLLGVKPEEFDRW